MTTRQLKKLTVDPDSEPEIPDPDLDPDCHQNLTDWSTDHVSDHVCQICKKIREIRSLLLGIQKR